MSGAKAAWAAAVEMAEAQGPHARPPDTEAPPVCLGAPYSASHSALHLACSGPYSLDRHPTKACLVSWSHLATFRHTCAYMFDSLQSLRLESHVPDDGLLSPTRSTLDSTQHRKDVSLARRSCQHGLCRRHVSPGPPSASSLPGGGG